MKNAPDTLIYELRKRNLSYQEIAKILQDMGVHTSMQIIKKTCNKIYMKNGEEEPVVKGDDPRAEKIQETYSRIIELKEIGKYTGKKISEMIKEEFGIDYTPDTINRIYRKYKMGKLKHQNRRHQDTENGINSDGNNNSEKERKEEQEDDLYL